MTKENTVEKKIPSAPADKTAEASGKGATSKPADSAKSKSAAAKRRKRARQRRRKRMMLKIVKVIVITMLVLAIGGIGIWLLFDQKPEISIKSYPVKYEDLIRKYAQENEIPPAYVASVILAESSYRPEVVSYADARGLMQILPSTGEWIAKKLDIEFTDDCLFDPETNIRLGCWYLGFLMNRYDGDMKCSSSAYHAGQGTVDKWLKNPEYSSDGKTLAVIPSDATSTYVNRILGYYDKYEKIYAESDD